MLPTLAPGDYVIVDTRSLAQVVPQAIVVAKVASAANEPKPETIVIKRILSRGDSAVYLGSDNPNEGRDSRHFGSVPTDALLGTVVFHLELGRFTQGR